jgi:Cd2+/Zn2+-exporting ATPase
MSAAQHAAGAPSVPVHDEHEHAQYEGHGHQHELTSERTMAPAWLWRYLRRDLVAVTLSGVALALGFLGVWSGWPGQVTAALFLVSILAGAVEIVPRGLRGVLRERSLDINFLITLAVLGAVLLGEYGEGATVVFLFALGEALEGITMARTRRAIEALMAIAPETAQVKASPGTLAGAPGDAERTVRAEAVPVGSIVVVRPGDRIPLDGVVVEGRSVVDQAPITGESVPVDRAPGDAVYGGTINGTGYLEVRTTRPFAENTLSRIIHLVQTAQSEKAPSQRLVERFARVYTPLVVLAAVLVAVVPALVFGQPIEPWFQRALVLLLIACPCALVLATPVAVVAAIGNASRHGVLIKGGVYLEKAGELRAVAFDKTGTLTRGVPEVQGIVSFDGLSESDALRLAAAVEARSEHPLAQAVVRAAARRDLDGLPAVREFQSFPGQGVQATVVAPAGRGAALDDVYAGKPAWLEAQGLSLEPARTALADAAAAGQTAVLLAGGRNGTPHTLLAVLTLADEVRPAAAETVQILRRMGVQRVLLLSGDEQATAGAVGARVGIVPEDARGELLPEDKVQAMEELVGRYGQVAMVGDGVNDAPALASATVGIAMGAGGSATALETADVALVADDLTRVPWVLDLSRRASRTIKANVAFALLSKAVVIALAVAGLANLWLAIATDVGATILVILNGMRLLGDVSTAGPADATAARRRYGLSEASADGSPSGAHAGHAH